MTDKAVKNLKEALQKDPELTKRLSSAKGPEEFESLAAEAGYKISAGDFFKESTRELTDAELENATGGYTFPRTDWLYCDNPWTNYWCTLRC